MFSSIKYVFERTSKFPCHVLFKVHDNNRYESHFGKYRPVIYEYLLFTDWYANQLLKFEDIEWVIRAINGGRTENTMAKLKGRKDKQ